MAGQNFISIIFVLSIGLNVINALWIPIPRNTNRIPQLVRTVNVQRPTHTAASFPVAMKKSIDPIVSLQQPIQIPLPTTVETQHDQQQQRTDGHQQGMMTYEVEMPSTNLLENDSLEQGGSIDKQSDHDQDQEKEGFDIDKHWPITPNACLILMKILHAQTAEFVENGQTESDFYEAASYYSPAKRTFFKCMEMADRGYEN